MRQYKPFRFKQFNLHQEFAAMKVGTDSILLGSWASVNSNDCILDIGTGTGVLSLMLAQKVNGCCTIDAIEIEKGALVDAERNFLGSPWPNCFQLFAEDFNSFISDTLYDTIISNPPYFNGVPSKTQKRNLARNSQFGISFENLLLKANQYLKMDGRLYISIPNSIKNKIVLLAEKQNLYLKTQLNIRPTINKQHNIVLAEFRKSNPGDKPLINELVIMKDINNYSDEFIELTREFYLDTRLK